MEAQQKYPRVARSSKCGHIAYLLWLPLSWRTNTVGHDLQHGSWLDRSRSRAREHTRGRYC